MYTSYAKITCKISCKCPQCGKTVLVDQTFSERGTEHGRVRAEDAAYRSAMEYTDAVIARACELSNDPSSENYGLYIDLGVHHCPECGRLFDWCSYNNKVHRADVLSVCCFAPMFFWLWCGPWLLFGSTNDWSLMLPVYLPVLAPLIVIFAIVRRRYKRLRSCGIQSVSSEMQKVIDRETLPLICCGEKMPPDRIFDNETRARFLSLYGDNERARLLMNAEYAPVKMNTNKDD